MRRVMYGTSDVLPSFPDLEILIVAGDFFRSSSAELVYFTLLPMDEFFHLPPSRQEEEKNRYWPFPIDPEVEIEEGKKIISAYATISSFDNEMPEQVRDQSIETAAKRISEWRQQKGGWIVCWDYSAGKAVPIRASSNDKNWPKFKEISLGELFTDPYLKPGGTMIYYVFGSLAASFTLVVPAKEKPDVLGAFCAGISLISVRTARQMLMLKEPIMFQEEGISVLRMGELDLLTPQQWAALYFLRRQNLPPSLRPFSPAKLPDIPGWFKIPSHIYLKYASSSYREEARRRIREGFYSALCFSSNGHGWWLEP